MAMDQSEQICSNSSEAEKEDGAWQKARAISLLDCYRCDDWWMAFRVG